jgi:signal transduction histidine kinase
MRELASEVIRSGDEERYLTSWRLHESAAQSIAAVSWQLGAIAQEVANRDVEGRLLQIKGVIEEVLVDVRHLAETMHPRVLDDLGLAAALTQLARKFEEASGVPVSANVDRSLAKSINKPTAAALYRTAQEALSNAISYAQPTCVRIWFFEQHGTVRLEVIDDGIGFDVRAAERNRGSGIFAMRDRLALVNTELLIESVPGSGTRVCAYIGKKPVHLEKTA